MKPLQYFLLIAFLVAALTFGYARAHESYFYVGMGLGKTENLFGSERWNDGGGTGTSFGLGFAGRIDSYGEEEQLWWKLHYNHLSQIDVGFPFNDEDEDEIDHYGIWIEYRWY